jgi:putative endonuclease
MHIRNRKKHFGDFGERLALNYIESHGFQLIIPNFRCRVGEIDIIALRNGILTIIEVKYRNSGNSEDALDSITYKKRLRISRATREFLYIHPEYYDYPLQFDVITVIKHPYFDEYYLKHYEDIFDIVSE